MPADAQIRITAENQTPQAFRQVDQSLKSLDQQTRAVQSSTRQSAAALGLFDDEAKQAAIGVTSLGRSVFNTSNEARKFGGVYRSIDGRLRESNGRFVKGREAVDQLGRSFQRTGKNAGLLGRGLTRASGGANILTRSVGSLGGVLGALSIAAVTHEIGRFWDYECPDCGTHRPDPARDDQHRGECGSRSSSLREFDSGGKSPRLAAGGFDALFQPTFCDGCGWRRC